VIARAGEQRVDDRLEQPACDDGHVRILVTNDDGISSVGLHRLAQAMTKHGEVTVVAPDREFSGAGAALGALYRITPEAHRVNLDGIDTAWAVNGAPALCVYFARLGAFGGPFDLVVSGINPGANVGWSVYHSGTIGACLTARNGGISGIAVSQAVTGWGVLGQGWDDMIKDQNWDSAAEVADSFVGGFLANGLPADPVVVNINVPDMPVADMAGWRRTEVANRPIRTMATAELLPIEGQSDSYRVKVAYGDKTDLPVATDGGAIEADEVAITYLSQLAAVDEPDSGDTAAALNRLLGRD
jgi:5'-nucleotidase